MKIVGVLMLLMGIAVSEVSVASILDCKGNMFTKLSDGNFGFEQLRIMEKPLFEEKMTVVSKDGKISFETKRKSDEWIYYTDSNNTEMLYVTGYRNITRFEYSDMRPNRESFLKFKENAVVGFNIVCRM